MKKMRRNIAVVFTVCMFVNVGMWLERFVIIVTSLHRDFLPSSWEMYYPTIWDFMTLAGTIGLFTTLMFLFVRVLPMIAIFEMQTLLPPSRTKAKEEGGAH
jgi:molybdopterin-containing oxidoreductase family membrane subunit